LGYVLYSKRIFILVTVAIAIFSCLWLNRVLPKAYESTASFYVPSQTDVISLTTETSGSVRDVPAPAVFRDQLRAFFGILTSARVAQGVRAVIPGHSLDEIRRATRFQLNSAGLFQVTAVDRNPIVAAQIANAYVQSFNDLFEQISLPKATKTRMFIEEQLENFKSQLAAAERNLQEFEQQHQAVSISEQTSRLLTQLADFRNQTRLAEVAWNEARARISAVEDEIRAEERMKVTSQVSQLNPLTQELRRKSNELKVELAGLGAEITPEHPEFANKQQQFSETNHLLDSEAPRIVSSETVSLSQVYEGLQQDLLHHQADEKALQVKLQGLGDASKSIEKELQRIPAVQLQVGDLVRNVQHLEEIQRTLALRLEDARIQERREIQTFLVVDRAEAAENPAYPSLLVSLPASTVFGGLCGAMFALFLVFLESRDTRGIEASTSISSLSRAGDSNDPIRLMVREEVSKMIAIDGQQWRRGCVAPASSAGRLIFALCGSSFLGLLCGTTSHLAAVLFIRTLS
jgi:uncharacterized protein involved in exopolysaccharide biosynthesis